MCKPYCETCGESEQEVTSTHAGLCGDCYGASIAQIVHEATGDRICGHPLYVAGRVVAVCTVPHGTEHAHGVIEGLILA